MARLLLFEPRMLGDAILSLPFVRGAMEKAEVTVCCLPKTAPIYRWLLPPERVIEWEVPWDCTQPAAEKWRHFRRVTQQIRSLSVDVAVSVWPDARVHVWMALLGAPHRVSFPMNPQNYYCWERPWRKRAMHIGQGMSLAGSLVLCRPLLTQPVQKKDPNQSHLDCWRQLAAVMGLPFRDETPWMPARTLASGSPLAEFVEQERRANRRLWMIHPGARVAPKQWPLANFQKLADAFFPSQECSLVVIRPPDAARLEIRQPHQIEFTASNLDELAAAVAQVDGVLCNDSMISHLAAACGKKVVSLFGPSQVSWFAPFANERHVVSIDVCPHRPCMNHCVMSSPICIEQIGCDAVEAALRRAMEEGS